MSFKFLLTPLLVVAVCCAVDLVATIPVALAEGGVAPRGVALEQGLPLVEVQKRWGAPKEREERETKRQELWRYANSEVLFEDGKVISWHSAAIRTAVEEANLAPTAAPLRKRAPKPLKDETVHEILNELQGFGSSSPGSPGSDSASAQGFPRPTPMGMYPGRADMNMAPD